MNILIMTDMLAHILLEIFIRLKVKKTYLVDNLKSNRLSSLFNLKKK